MYVCMYMFTFFFIVSFSVGFLVMHNFVFQNAAKTNKQKNQKNIEVCGSSLSACEQSQIFAEGYC